MIDIASRPLRQRGTAGLRSLRRLLTPRVLAGALLVAFAGLRILTVVRPPLSVSDTSGYTILSFIGGTERPWTVPLVWQLLPTPGLREAGQLAIGICAWSVLALSLGSVLDDRRLKAIGMILVLLLGLLPQVAGWDSVLLSESISTSMLALLMAVLLRLTKRQSPRLLALSVAVACLWVFARETNVLIYLALLPFVVVFTVWRLRWRRGLAVAGALLLLGAWSGYVITRPGPTQPEIYNAAAITAGRIARSPAAQSFFRSRGLPVVRLPTPTSDQIVWRTSARLLATPRVRSWLEHSFKSTYLAYLRQDPVRAVSTSLSHAARYVASSSSEVRVRPVLPARVDALLWTLYPPPMIIALMLTTLVLVLSRAWVPGFRGVPLGLLLLAATGVGCVVVWNTTDASFDEARQFLVVAVMGRLAVIVGLALGLDALVSSRLKTPRLALARLEGITRPQRQAIAGFLSRPRVAHERLASALTLPSGYRPALDGVRAVAVLAVIAYHMDTRLGGGFLGVDIFFVLSGYLITSLLLRERVRTGTIRLTRFWARRARRLLPAVLALCVVAALYTAHTGAVGTYAARRADLLSTIFYFANWHFIAVGNSYFAQFAGASPLTHMWSLAIEEQFYLAWPLIVLLGATWLGRRDRTLLVILALAVLASAIRMATLYTPIDPTRAYEGTDARAFELLAGAFLATLLVVRPRLLHSRPVAAAARWGWPLIVIGVGAALFAMTAQGSVYFRGGGLAFSLLVAAGLLIVEGAPRSPLARVLALGPVRWIGTISYSLYLWHWPIIVWSQGRALTWNPRVKELAELVAMFAAATLSAYLLERPIRYGRVPWLRTSSRRLAAVLAAGVAIVVGVTLHSTSSGASPLLAHVAYGGRNCPAGSPMPARPFAWCRRATARPPGAPTIALVGDSTALALDYGIQSVASRRGWGYVEAGENGCSILPLMFPDNPQDPASVAGARQCVTGIPRLLSDLARRVHPSVWLVSDRWMLLPLKEPDGRVLQPGNPRRSQIIASALHGVLRRLVAGGSKVIYVITPPPGPPPQCAIHPSASECTASTYSTHDGETDIAQHIVDSVADGMHDVFPVDIDDILCPDHGYCPAVIDGALARYDGIHYTYEESLKLAPAIFDRAQRAGLRLGQ